MNSRGRKVQTAPRDPAAVRHFDKTAISLAVDNPSLGDTSIVFAALSAQSDPAKPNRSRKARYRDYKNLKPWQVRMVFEGDAAARWRRRPLNTVVSVNGSFTRHGTLTAKGFHLARRRLSQWLLDRGLQPLWLYTHENPTDGVGFAKANTHILCHIPSRLHDAFKARLDSWFNAADANAIDLKRRYGPREQPLRYMTKGGDYLTCRRYGGHRRSLGGQGIVSIKRAGASKALLRAVEDMKAVSQSSSRWGRGSVG